MAFFGLTQLGYQDPIREHVNNTGVTPQHVFHSGLYRQPPYSSILATLPTVVESDDKTPAHASIHSPPNAVVAPSNCDRNSTARAAVAPGEARIYGEGGMYSRGYAGDGVSYSDLRERMDHQKYQHEPTCVYRRPVTTSDEIGQWMRSTPIHDCEPWTRVPRYPLINSELTRFVNEMGKTNKEFSLY